MEDSITLGVLEQRRLLVLNDIEAGSLTVSEGAQLVGLSPRQLRRVRSAYREAGGTALSHGNRGRRPANSTDAAVAERVLDLATHKYVGFNQHHLTEMLAEEDGIQLSRSTVRRILAAAGVSADRRRRPPRHRSRRDRYPRAGMLLQIDGSRHDWLEGRGPRLSLLGGIDDATGTVPAATFRDQEDAHGYFVVLRRVVTGLGIPAAVYSDQHSIFQYSKATLTLEEQLTGRPRPTQFGRLLAELGVQLILARSPQAKGRIERLWGTFQDRLCSELRLVGAATREHAEAVLTRFLPRHNRRFAVAPTDPDPAWIPPPCDLDLDRLFCFKHQRVVARDNTVRFGPLLIDIPPAARFISYARSRVEIHERFDGSVHVFLRQQCLASVQLPPRSGDFRSLVYTHDHLPTVPRPAPRTPAPLPRETNQSIPPPWKPPRSHPWRQ